MARLREQGEAVHLVSKRHCSDGRPLVRRPCAGGSAQKLDWLVVEEITSLDMALWADLACVGLNADVKFLLLGDFRQSPAVLDSWAGRPISAFGAQPAYPRPGRVRYRERAKSST